VLAAVHFDDQPRRETNEVDDKVIDRHLAPKMKALFPQRAEKAPELSLGVG